MNKVAELEAVLTELFRSGVSYEEDEDEQLALLDDIDYAALLQGLNNEAGPIYEYHAYNPASANDDMDYYGPLLFPFGAMLLYEDETDYTDENVTCSRVLELWLLPDMSFAVTSRFTVSMEDGSYETEFRTYKGNDWQEAGMTIDFEDLADDLEAMCAYPVDEGLAFYEL